MRPEQPAVSAAHPAAHLLTHNGGRFKHVTTHTHLTPLEGYIYEATLLSEPMNVQHLPVLEEADEGGNSGAWPHHHEGHRHISRRSEGAGRPQAHVDLGSKAVSERFEK